MQLFSVYTKSETECESGITRSTYRLSRSVYTDFRLKPTLIMPPKGKGKKEKKLTKEEEEAKLREEEEARLRAEQEEAEKKAKEKYEREERRRLELEEKKRRKAQLIELHERLDDNEIKIKEIYNERRVHAKWERFMRCDGSPNPTIQGQINTYMNLWREDEERVHIEDVMDDSELCLILMEELSDILAETPRDELSEIMVLRYNRTIDEMQTLLNEKLQRATHQVLLDATEMADPETSNLQKVFTNDVINLCVWGNLSKNPRIKSFEFIEKGLSFDIPKILTLSDIAVVGLFTKYDHLSHYSRSYNSRQKTIIIEPTPEPIAVQEDEKPQEEDDKEIEREETEDVMAALMHIDDEEDTEKEEEEVKVDEQEDEIIEDDEAKTPVPPEWEDFEESEEYIDLRAYNTLGGIFQFSLCHMPPQPKTVDTWIMRQVISPALNQPFDYISDLAKASWGTPSIQNESSSNNIEDQKSDAGTEKKRDEKPPINVQLKLPEDVHFSDEPEVVRWDTVSQQWSNDNFSDVTYNADERTVSFKTNYFGVMALMQDTHIDMPFQSWEMRPRGINHCKITIIAAINEVEIEIKDEHCCLVAPTENPQLQHLLNKWMIPRKFMEAMKKSGLNFFPNEDSSKYVQVQEKNGLTEDRLYVQMALTASTMAYSWSKWNADRDNNTIILQGAEKLKDEPLTEEEWSLFMVNRKRSTKLRMTEFDESFNEDWAEGTTFHADMYHMALELASPDGQERVKKSDHFFVDTVQQMLKATKLLTFS